MAPIHLICFYGDKLFGINLILQGLIFMPLDWIWSVLRIGFIAITWYKWEFGRIEKFILNILIMPLIEDFFSMGEAGKDNLQISKKLLTRLLDFNKRKPEKNSWMNFVFGRKPQPLWYEQQHPLIIAALTLGLTLGIFYLTKQLTRKFKTAMDIPPTHFKQKRFIKCQVVAVNDSDNLRVRHLSFLDKFLNFGLRKGDLKYETINVRLAGIDAPELGHFTKSQPQPLSSEALKWLEDNCLGKTITAQLYRLDQYNRAIAMIWIPKWFFFRKCINLEMIKAGYACIYRQSGGEYGELLNEFEKCEAEAKKKKIGIWGLKNLVLPSEYKKLK
jgi:endonuclease YncB( thermonuclease family)